MLDDPKAIEIISRARQKNVASASRSEHDFDCLLKDFFSSHEFTGELIMDLGPGQYDFARRVRDAGGTVEHIDKDPAVVELGQYLGFEVAQGNLRSFDYSKRKARYDGLFCKFSINAFWFQPADEVRAAIRAIDSMLKPAGWGWIAPWNGLPKNGWEDRDPNPFLDAQAEAFSECGWAGYELTDDLTDRYGITGNVQNHALFVRNLGCCTALDAATPIVQARVEHRE